MASRLKLFIPLFLFAVLAIFLFRGLALDPKEMPSALIDQPLPEFTLPQLGGDSLLTRNNIVGQPSLLNVWATWCGPCVAEMPSLVEIGRQFETRGFDLITISLDAPEQVETAGTMLKRFHAAMPKLTEASVQEEGRTTNNYLFEGDTDALAEALDNEWQGPIPYTVLIAPGGEILYRKSGEIDADKLRRVIVDRLGRFYTTS